MALGLLSAIVVTIALVAVLTTVIVLPVELDTYRRVPSGFTTMPSGAAPTLIVPTTVLVVVSITVTVPALLLVTYARLLLVATASAPLVVTSPVLVIAAG